MTERFSDVKARIDTVRQLASVVTAIRGIAAARAREARERLASVEAYAATVGRAIGEALALLPQQPGAANGQAASGGGLLLVFCAEQGFAGAVSRKVLEEARARVEDAELLLVGSRGQMLAGELGLRPLWATPMISHVVQTAALADDLAGRLSAMLAEGRPGRVSLAHARPVAGGVETVVKQLLPFDFARFPPAAGPEPLTTLPPLALARKLAEEHVFAELCEAILLSYAAENEARTLALLAARANVDRKLDALLADARRLRQDAITSEVVELAAGAAAKRLLGD